MMAIMAGGILGCSSAPPKKAVTQPVSTYDDTSLRQNVRKALDDADAQLPGRPR